MRKVIMLRGLPASGKTTWSRDFIEEQAANSWIRINKDDLRKMFSSEYSRGMEKFVLRARDILLSEALDDGKSVIIDDTNLNPAHERDIRAELAMYNTGRKHPVQFEIKDFTDIPTEECIRRDYERENPVGEIVIREMCRRWMSDTRVHKQT